MIQSILLLLILAMLAILGIAALIFLRVMFEKRLPMPSLRDCIKAINAEDLIVYSGIEKNDEHEIIDFVNLCCGIAYSKSKNNDPGHSQEGIQITLNPDLGFGRDPIYITLDNGRPVAWFYGEIEMAGITVQDNFNINTIYEAVTTAYKEFRKLDRTA